MKCVLAVCIFSLAAALGVAQTSGAIRPEPSSVSTSSSPAPSSATTNLEPILAEVQKAAQAANTDIIGLNIDRWRADSTQRAQMQQVADSLHKNIAYAVPDLISEVRSSHGSVSSAFKLYHNISVVYEYLNSLTDAAGSLGKREEYDPLNRDTNALDQARQHLSAYIEQAAASLENQLRAALATPTPTPAPQTTPTKIIVGDDTPKKKSVTPKKKRTSTPPPRPSPTPN